MRPRCVLLILLLTAGPAATQSQGQLWKHFVPTARSAVKQPVDDKLTQENGPWLIVAATFSGNGAEEQARALAAEFRQRYRMSAYIHEMSFDYSDKSPGRGVDQYGAPIRRRYQRGDHVREIAVLVGDYRSVEDPDAQAALDRVKTMDPKTLQVGEGQHTSQSMAQIREWQDHVLERLGKKRERGPMAQAFLTRNPLLPREYFVPRGVDDFVAKMNRGVEHSLLGCPGLYTVKVATFRGTSILQTSATSDAKSGSIWGRKKRDADNPLVEAAENAHLLTEELRAHGWEAFEFHDRTESIVAIGSFAEAARRMPNGQLVPTPEVQRIIETFGAAYDTPSDPLSNIGNDDATQQRVHQKEQEFNLRLSGQQNQIVPGLNPKHVKIFKGSKRKSIERVIPMDVYPTAIEVPKRSISSAYAG